MRVEDKWIKAADESSRITGIIAIVFITMGPLLMALKVYYEDHGLGQRNQPAIHTSGLAACARWPVAVTSSVADGVNDYCAYKERQMTNQVVTDRAIYCQHGKYGNDADITYGAKFTGENK